MRVLTVRQATDAGVTVPPPLNANPDLFVLVDDDESVLFWSSVRDDVVRAERAYR